MTSFKEFTLKHISNGSVVQDGFDVYAIRNNGTEVWAATSGENLSRLQVEVDIPLVEDPTDGVPTDGSFIKPAADDRIYTVGSVADYLYTYEHMGYLQLLAYINYVNNNKLQGEELITFLWDALKKETGRLDV